MWPTAISEVVEQVIRVATVLTAAWILIPRGVEYAAAGAAFGTCTGGCASLLFLLLVLMFIKRREVQTDRQPLQLGEKIKILKKLILYAFPISAGSLVLPLAQVIDTVIIPQRLQAVGMTMQEATSQFGQLSGMAGTVVFLPAVFTVSIAMSLVPHLASYRTNRTEINQRINSALRITIIICLPAAAGLMMLAAPIMDLLFDDPGCLLYTSRCV